MCSCDSEPSTVWSSETRVAAKDHPRCDWCEEAISKGSRYVRIASLFDGSWSTFKMHTECDAAADRGDCYCLIHGDESLPRGMTPDERLTNDVEATR